MSFKSRFYAIAPLVAFLALAPLTSAQAGQLFPPADLAAAGTPSAACPNGTVLTWGKLASSPTDPVIICADPTPGVTVTCPTGQMLTGVTKGVANCTPITDYKTIVATYGASGVTPTNGLIEQGDNAPWPNGTASETGSSLASCPSGYTLMFWSMLTDLRTQSGVDGWNNGGTVGCGNNNGKLEAHLWNYSKGSEQTSVSCIGLCKSN